MMEIIFKNWNSEKKREIIYKIGEEKIVSRETDIIKGENLIKSLRDRTEKKIEILEEVTLASNFSFLIIESEDKHKKPFYIGLYESLAFFPLLKNVRRMNIKPIMIKNLLRGSDLLHYLPINSDEKYILVGWRR